MTFGGDDELAPERLQFNRQVREEFARAVAGLGETAVLQGGRRLRIALSIAQSLAASGRLEAEAALCRQLKQALKLPGAEDEGQKQPERSRLGIPLHLEALWAEAVVLAQQPGGQSLEAAESLMRRVVTENQGFPPQVGACPPEVIARRIQKVHMLSYVVLIAGVSTEWGCSHRGLR